MRAAPLLALLLCASAGAQGPAPRFAVVAAASVDGQPDDAGPLQALLGQALVARGVRLVDAAQAERVRRAVSADAAAKGALPAGLASADADWVLGATATCRTLSTEIRPDPKRPPDRIWAANCDVSFALTRLDTGDVAGRASLFGKGPAATGREAARRAQERAVRELESKHLGAMLARAAERRPIVAWLVGAQERPVAELVRGRIAAVAGVESASLVDFAPDLSRLEVALAAGGGMDLAEALDRDPAVPVRVERASGGRLTLRYDPVRSLRTRFTVPPFTDRAKDRARADALRTAPQTLAALLANSPFLVAAGAGEAAQVIVNGELARGRGGPAITLVARDPAGVELARARADGAGGLEKAARSLEEQLPLRLARRGGPAAELPQALEQARRLRALEVVRFEAADVFPARLARYQQDEPVATLWVRSAGAQAVEGVVARAWLEGFSPGPRLEAAVTVPPGGGAALPVRAALDGAKLAALTQSTIVPLRVELTWRQGEVERAETFVHPLRLMERGAVDWRETGMAAAFVTPRDPAVQDLLSRALRVDGAAQGLPPQLERAARLVGALSALNLRYVPDPVIPFGSATVDFVSFPRETLARRTGDCDDLAVLAASLFEAAGIPTRLVTTPGHILVAFDAGVPPLHALDVAFHRGQALILDGRTFIPLEATALGKGFLHAWDEGAKEVARHQRTQKLAQVSVRESWQRYPPAAVEARAAGATGATGEPLSDQALESNVRSALASLHARREAAVQARIAGVSAALARKPADTALRAEHVFLLAWTGRLAEAEGVARGAPFADAAPVQLSLANVLTLRGELDAAEALLAQPGAPAGAAAHLHNLAIVLFLKGDDAGAEASLARALELDGTGALLLEAEAGTGRAEERTPPLVLKSDLAELLERSRARTRQRLEKTEAAAPAGQRQISAGRRGEDPESATTVAAALRWPLPEPAASR